jgi:hypothetical protein
LKYVTIIDVDCKGLGVEVEASTNSAGLHRNAFELWMKPLEDFTWKSLGSDLEEFGKLLVCDLQFLKKKH